MDLSIVIVNYNTCEHLNNCLKSLYSFITGLDFEVIIVDNNSPDRSIELLPKVFPEAKFFFRNINDGFGSGCNYGTEQSTGRYTLFVNPDIVFLNNLNLDLLKFMEKNRSVAVISPLYFEENEKMNFFDEFPGFYREANEAFGDILTKLSNLFFTANKKKNDLPFEIDWVAGSYMFTRTEAFKSVNGFDENFFLYYEDIDLQLRIRKLGYKIICHPSYEVRHIARSSVSSFKGENLFYYHLTRSNLIYMYKHFNFIKRNLIRGIHLIGILVRILALPIRRNYSEKRRQKLFQYIWKTKQFLSTKRQIFKNEIFLDTHIGGSH